MTVITHTVKTKELTEENWHIFEHTEPPVCPACGTVQDLSKLHPEELAEDWKREEWPCDECKCLLYLTRHRDGKWTSELSEEDREQIERDYFGEERGVKRIYHEIIQHQFEEDRSPSFYPKMGGVCE